MGLVELTTLGIRIDAPEVSFHDDGEMSDLVAHTGMLNSRYGTAMDPGSEPEKVRGFCYAYSLTLVQSMWYSFWRMHGVDSDVRTLVHIYYKQMQDEVTDLFTVGHEQGHVLDHVRGGFTRFSDQLQKLSGKTILVQHIHDEEIRAHIAGLYALHRAGMNYQEVQWTRPNAGFDKAVDLFEKVKEKLPAECPEFRFSTGHQFI